ncbi:MAG: putrescine aminotransferase [Desulfobulbus sp.]|nr:MAG: putrescine aminotransferase [Desulfobulbus sp.]RUM38643.1 MAG: putrescine aminotransferase [Desulfobulbus sp.]
MPEMIKVEDVSSRPREESVELFRKHINPGLVVLLEMGEYTAITPVHAEGAVITTQENKHILDFVSSYGALNLGHNHPQVLNAVQEVTENKRVDLSKELLSPYAAYLAHNLSQVTPADLNKFFFCNSGTEATEAALKLAARCFKGKRPQFIYAKNSLHGKTLGALSFTGAPRLREYFPLLPGFEVPFGKSEAIEKVLSDKENLEKIAGVILEPIQGEAGVIVPPAGYLQEVRAICDRYGVLLILDEIQTGMCRTGAMFACNHEQVIPDILVLAKSLGGGVASIGATICSEKVFATAYGNPHECLVQTSTFGGRSTACAAAMAALTVSVNEDLAERAARLGKKMLADLRKIQKKHPGWIREVRGRGLMLGIEFDENILKQAKSYLPLHIPGLKTVLREHLPGMVAAALLKQFGILGTLMLNNRSVLRVYPPLIIAEKDLDYFIRSLDALLAQGPKNLVKNRVNHALSSSGLKFITSWTGALTGTK